MLVYIVTVQVTRRGNGGQLCQGVNPATRVMEAAAKPPSAFCPALAALLACLLVGINQAAALPIAISVFPFSRQPVLIAACAINILGTLIGLIGSSASLCCSTLWCTSPFCARGLLATSAAIFVSMGGVMAYGCVNACAYAIRARPDDWLAWVDGDGQSWRYVDRCSGDRYTFSPLPFFLANAVFGLLAAAFCIKLLLRHWRIDAFKPGVSPGLAPTPARDNKSAVSVAGAALFLFLATSIWAGVTLGMMKKESMHFVTAATPPPTPPHLPPQSSPPPPSPPDPRHWNHRDPHMDGMPCPTSCSVAGCDFHSPSCRCACNHKCVKSDDCCDDYEPVCTVDREPSAPPPPAPARPPPEPAFPRDGSPFTLVSGPCIVVGHCVTSSKYVPCVDTRWCVGPSCVGAPCPLPAHLPVHLPRRSYSYDHMVMEDDGFGYNALSMPSVAPQDATTVDPAYSLLKRAPDTNKGYSDNERCLIRISDHVRLETPHFDTERCCDKLSLPVVHEGLQGSNAQWSAPHILARPMAASAMRMPPTARATTRGLGGGADATPMQHSVASFGGNGRSKGPEGWLAAPGMMSWRSDGGVTASGWAVCAAGYASDAQIPSGSKVDAAGVVHFVKPGPAYPWFTFPSAVTFLIGTLAASLLGVMAAALAFLQPLPAASVGECCKGRRASACARTLSLLAMVGMILSCSGLVRTTSVVCMASSHLCAQLLPVWWAGALLTALSAFMGLALTTALSPPPPPADASTRLEHRLALYMRALGLFTMIYGIISLIVTIVLYPFRRLAGLYVFVILQIVMPAFGIAGAMFVLQGRSQNGASAATGRGADALLLLRSRPALVFLGLNTFFVGSTVIGLPVTAAGGYGSGVITYLLGAIFSLANASLSLALSVLLYQATSADERSERAGLALTSQRGSSTHADDAGGDLHGQLHASERRVEEMDKKMIMLLEQQTQLMALLATTATATQKSDGGPASPQPVAPASEGGDAGAQPTESV